MTVSLPVERVLRLLTKGGYRLIAGPLHIASIPFEFAAALEGGDRALELIVVIDGVTGAPQAESDKRLQIRIEGLARALDLIGSRRSLTAIVVGPPPGQVSLEAMSRVSRVLLVGTPLAEDAERMLLDALAVLMPLELPAGAESPADPVSELWSRLAHGDDRATAQRFLDAAADGPARVEQVLADFVSEPLAPPDEIQP